MIYVVDDDASVRKALGRLFQSAGLPAAVFASGAEFLARLPADADGCLIVDIQMPDLSGHEVQAGLAGRGRHLPVIAVSAGDDARAREQARALGAVAFFRKPVDGQALLDTISWVQGGAH